MENKHLKAIKEVLGNTYYNKITVLNINEIYKHGSKELIETLKTKVVM